MKSRHGVFELEPIEGFNLPELSVLWDFFLKIQCQPS